MLNKLTQQYRKRPSLHRIVLGVFLTLGIFFGLYTFATTLPFSDNLTSIFGITGDSNYSTMHFNYGGNDFAGIMFRLTGEDLSTPQNITVNGGTQSIDCYRKLNGLFYNNERGRRMWPLDTDTLATLQSYDSSYDNLTQLTGGLYTDCVEIAGTFANPIHLNEVYGAIYHQWSGTDFWLIAGVDYTFNSTGYNPHIPNKMQAGSLFSGTLRITTGGEYTGWIFDSYGGIADITLGDGAYCGDGITNAGEQCDDGNATDNDGCSSGCALVMPTCSGLLLDISPYGTGNTNYPVYFTLTGSWANGISFLTFSGIAPEIFTTGWATTGTISYIHPYFSLIGLHSGTYTVRNNYSGSYSPLTCPWTYMLVSGATICQGFAITPVTTIYTGGATTFTCTGQNIDSCNLSITSGAVSFFSDTTGSINDSCSRTTGSSLPLGHYSATCTVYSGSDNNGCADKDLDVVEPSCQGFSMTPAIINTGSNTTFTCQGTNVSGYILNIFSGSAGSGSLIYTNTVSTGATSYSWTTGAGLPLGNYTATCTILGSGATGPQCGSGLSLGVQVGCNPNFQGDVTFGPGQHIINVGGISYYTDLSHITVYISVTEPVNYVLTGDFAPGIYTGIHPGTGLIYPIHFNSVGLAAANTRTHFYSTYQTGTCTYIDARKRVMFDNIGPTPATLLGPINGTGVCASSTFQISWTASIDSGAGLSGYVYHLYNSGLVYSGIVGSEITGVTLNATNYALGNYSRTVTAYDQLGNSTTSSTGTFVIGTQYCGSGNCCSCCCIGGGAIYLGSIPSVRNANLNTAYLSDVFYAFGITGPTTITVSNGMLFINGSGVGSTGIVNPGNSLQIDLLSSDEHDTTVSSFVSMGGYYGAAVYNVTTKTEGDDGDNCNLTSAEKLTILGIYNSLKDQYDDDANKLQDFLDTFKSMVQDNVDLTDDCSLQYLLDLIEGDLNNDNNIIDTSIHIAPNCKKYNVAYDDNQSAYYSPDMKRRFYFVNRETLIRHIDYYNAGDCHINTYGNASRSSSRENSSEHIAPNGKIYTIQGSNGAYTCPEFAAPKYFDSLDGMIRYIDIQNPAKEIWDHQVDVSFTPITYMAPNGKEYRIYKTSRGYMSYKLMKVRYYETLNELENYITVQNPVKY